MGSINMVFDTSDVIRKSREVLSGNTEDLDSNKMYSDKQINGFNQLLIDQLISSTDHMCKIIYVPMPCFDERTNIKGTQITPSVVKKNFSPLIWLLWGLFEGPNKVENKITFLQNNISIMFSNASGRYMVLSAQQLNDDKFDPKVFIRKLKMLNENKVDLDDEVVAMDENDEVDTPMKITNEEDLQNLLKGKKISLTDMDREIHKGNVVDAVIGDFTQSGDDLEKVILTNIENEKLSNKDKAYTILEKVNMISLRKRNVNRVSDKVKENMIKSMGDFDLDKVGSSYKNSKLESRILPLPHVMGGFNKIRIDEYENQYIKKLDKRDKGGIFASTSKTVSPLFISKIETKDISDRSVYADRYAVEYTSPEGSVHNIELDVPKLYKGDLFIAGSGKSITKQDAANPIIHCGEDVIVTTSYNKLFINIKGKYPSLDMIMMYRLLSLVKGVEFESIVQGNVHLNNLYQNKLNYKALELSKHLVSIHHSLTDTEISMDVSGTDIIETGEFKDCVCIGKIKGREVYIHSVEDKMNLYGHWYSVAEGFISIILEVYPSIDEKFRKAPKTIPKTIQSATTTIMAQNVPVVLIIMLDIGLIGLLDLLKETNGLEYEVYKSDTKVRNDRPFDYGVIQFSNFCIKVKYNNTLNTVLLSPLVNDIDLTPYEDIDVSNIINDYMGNGNFAIYVENFIDLFIDPMTLRVLEELNLPTQFSEVMIYGVSLLVSGHTTRDTDLSNYRLLSNTELVNRCLYDVLTKEYSSYIVKTKRGARGQFSIPKDAVMKKILELPNINEKTTLSPVQIISSQHSKSMKGASGINMDRSYTKAKRVYDPTYLGNTGLVTSIGANIGVLKKISMNPNVENLSGQYKILKGDEVENMEGASLMSMTESLIPYMTFHDSAPRMFMADSQYSHLVSSVDSNPLLVTYGSDEALAYMDTKFIIKPEQDGVITDITDDFITIQYKNGSSEIFPLHEVVRNSMKGWYFTNTMTLFDKYKKGTKVKAGDIIGYNPNFYKIRKPFNTVAFAGGPLVNMLVMDGKYTFEDSTIIFDSLSKRMGTPICKRIAKTIPLSTKVLYMTNKLNEEVDPDEVLMRFNLLTDDIELNEYFEKLGELDNTIIEVKPKTKGKLVDIVLSYRFKDGRDPISESMRDTIQAVNKMYDTNKHAGHLIGDPSISKFEKDNKINYPLNITTGSFSKINGSKIENGEILVEFFIEYVDNMGVTDKLVYNAALKGEICRVLPDNLAPVGCESGRRADAILNTYGLLARKVPSVVHAGLINALLIGMCDKTKKILSK
ncbi:MAG: hypothetical protein ACRCX2_22005 [Paraclostridium sp.]